MRSLNYDAVHKLAASDTVGSFDCGQPALNQFLQRFALVHQKSNSAQTYVTCCSDALVGFCSLAVDLRHQGAGLVKALLKDAPARQWYLNWEFEPSASDPFHLFLLLKDIKAMVHER